MPSIIETIEKLHSFRKLDTGWRFGEGGPPSDAIITKAEQYLRHAVKLGLEAANVFTGADREVVVGFYNKDDGRAIEITFEPDGSITFAQDLRNRQIDFIENISEVDLYQRIWRFHIPLLGSTSFVPSIRETSTRRPARLIAQHLERLAATAESRSSTVNVRSEPVAQSANTSDDTTPTKPSSPASTGPYPLRLCQTNA